LSDVCVSVGHRGVHVVQQLSGTGPISDARITWNMEKPKNNVALGNNHTLEMYTSIAWRPAAVGETLQTSSFGYFVGATAAAIGGEVKTHRPRWIPDLRFCGLSGTACHRLATVKTNVRPKPC
jgi:hypothetical protein